MPDLTAVGITAGYDGPPVLDKVGVHCEAGTTTVILGPNGAGKSTLAKAVVGLLTIREGTVTLLGEDITGMGPHKLVRRGLAYLPQLMNIFDQMTVIENLEMGGYTIQGQPGQADRHRHGSLPGPRKGSAEEERRAVGRSAANARPCASAHDGPEGCDPR